jgi:hypothetical protein
MLGTNQEGAIAETAFIHRATCLGFGVYRPANPAGRDDLILDVCSRLLRVQCKWAAREGDVVIVRCCSSWRSRAGIVHRAYTSEEIDGVAAYCAELDRCYLLPATWMGSGVRSSSASGRPGTTSGAE